LASGVQLPQHSEGGLFQPGTNGSGSVPSAPASQSDCDPVFGSSTVKRSFLASGDHRIEEGVPFTVKIVCAPEPSLRARLKLLPLAKTIVCPSGDQLAPLQTMLPTRCLDPVKVGTTQRGPSPVDPPSLPTTKSSEPLGEIPSSSA